MTDWQMMSTGSCVEEYTRAMAARWLPRAYRAILAALMAFQSSWKKAHPTDNVGALYQGYLDMSFISIAPAQLAAQRLKLSLVYLHDEGRFELWLAAANREIQAAVSKKLSQKPLGSYALTELKPGVDSIISCIVPQPYTFDLPEQLNQTLLTQAESFLSDMLALLDA